jgi:hypothetical protein
MLVTLIVVAALLGGAAVLTSLHIMSTRNVGLTNSQTSALYCAEAGLSTVRATVAASYPLWNDAFASGTEPSWLLAIDHDVDGDSVGDFEIRLRDNADDTGNDLTRDNDLMVFIVSTCTKYPDTPVEVTELVRSNGGGNCYQSQYGGCGGNANAN